MRRLASTAFLFATRSLTSQGSAHLQSNNTKEAAKKIRTNVSQFQRAPKTKPPHISSGKTRYGISPKAVELVEKVMNAEEVCKELDQWHSEGKFPIAYVKQSMQVLEREKQWDRLIQVSKWMLTRGEGKTLRTYESYLRALDMNQCVDQAEDIWKNEIMKSSWSIPTRLIMYALTMFERHHKPLEVIKLFTKMEDTGRNMPKKSIRAVARAYEEQGFLEMKKHVLLKYKIPVPETEAP